MAPRFSIVVPVYNEASFIPHAVPALVEAVASVGEDYEILIVENGSRDGSADAAREAGTGAPLRVISLDEADYGNAMYRGFAEATGEWIVNFDIDYFSGPFLRRVMETTGADIVIASKRDPESEDRRPLVRRLATFVFNLLLRTILGSRVSDTHGMKAFARHVIEKLNDDVVSRQDLFDTELVIRAERSGYRIEEVPVVVEEMRSARSSLVRRVPRTIAGLFRIRSLLRQESRTAAGRR